MTRTDQINSYHVRERERKGGGEKIFNECTHVHFIVLILLLHSFSIANNHRVPLKNEHPDYINAVFINVMHCHYFLVS